jgi:DNA-binding MarR family transcriptional regulator
MNSGEKQNPPIDIEIRKVWLKTYKMYNQTAMKYDVSFSLGMVLLSIDKGGTPSTQLGPKMGMEPTSLSRTLKLMSDQGLINRIQDKNDKRVINVSLTPKGITLRKIASEEVNKHNEKLYSSIDSNELTVFFKVLNQINDLTDY